MDRNPEAIHDESIKYEMALFMGIPSSEAVENNVSEQLKHCIEAYMTTSAGSPSASTICPSHTRYIVFTSPFLLESGWRLVSKSVSFLE